MSDLSNNFDNICNFCGKKFSSHRNLQTHIRSAKYCLKSRGEKIPMKYVCEHCNSGFTLKTALTSHMKSCKIAKSTKIENDTKLSQEKIAKLENTLVSQKESNARITQKLRTKLQLSKDEITKLTEENNELKSELKRSEQSKQQLLKELEEKRIKIREQKIMITTLQDDNATRKGILIGMNSAKPHTVNNKITNNNVVNQKLSLIPIDNIEPFTIDLVNRNLNKYDYNTFLKGALGIVNYIKELTILELDDGTVEKNYACTNRSRNTFHWLKTRNGNKTEEQDLYKKF